MDFPCGILRVGTSFDGPSARFLFSGGEERDEAEGVEGCFDEAVEA